MRLSPPIVLPGDRRHPELVASIWRGCWWQAGGGGQAMVEGLSRLGTSHQSQCQDAAGAGLGPRLVTHRQQKAGEPPFRAQQSARGQRSVLRLPPATGRPPRGWSTWQNTGRGPTCSIFLGDQHTGGPAAVTLLSCFPSPLLTRRIDKSAAGWVFWGALCSQAAAWQSWQPKDPAQAASPPMGLNVVAGPGTGVHGQPQTQ